MLRDARIRAGIGLRELSRRLGVSPSYLSRIERGKQRASWQMVQRVAEPLGCPVDALARSLGVMPPHAVSEARSAWLRGSGE